MSRIGKMPVELPKGVTVTPTPTSVTVKGPKGELSRSLPPLVKVSVNDNVAQVQLASGDRRANAMQGLTRALLQNMVTGVSEGFSRSLEINGVGYRAEVKGQTLTLVLGYSHPIEVTLPDGITAAIDRGTIVLSGIDKEKLGQMAAIIRDQRPPEPYKGKGVKYAEEHIRRKVGKAGSA